MEASMSTRSYILNFILCLVLLVPTISLAQTDPSVDELVKSLSPKALTRGLTTNPRPQMTLEEASHIINISRSATRGISKPERSNLENIVTNSSMPTIDMEINFAFNSDKLDQKSIITVSKLGMALNSDALKNQTFVLAGHTDAVGTADYNQKLSERRSAVVKNFLVQHFSIDPLKLVVAGYGQEQLKNKQNPYADENRRVQIINIGQVAKKNPESEAFNDKKEETGQQGDPLASLDGSWLSINPPGPSISFYQVGLGQRAAILSMGQASIKVSDGVSGSNLKISGEGFDCYYYVGFVSISEMIWQLKQGDSVCTNSAYYKRSIN